ncbi:MAG: DUF1256 domain-containing protein [Clostridia bacterium]|nr:DUF1256 domain-containing protein [Clostridia bacterium]
MGDSLAPKVGDNLIKNNIKAFVYGTSENPITALNYKIFYNHIINFHKNDFIIAIDCALGKKKDIGSIKITKQGVMPGKAIGKDLKGIGHIGILGQVGDINKPAFDELKNASSEIVDKIVDKITQILLSIVEI